MSLTSSPQNTTQPQISPTGSSPMSSIPNLNINSTPISSAFSDLKQAINFGSLNAGVIDYKMITILLLGAALAFIALKRK